jgi:HlyD family secretion protein
VIEVRVKDGDTVKTGDLLVKLDPTEAKARVDSASARAERLRTAIDQARRDIEKTSRDESQMSKLRDRGFSTVTELADARTAKAKAELAMAMCENDLRESEAMHKTFEQELSRTQILAPIDGVVAGLSVDVGEVVIAGTTNLKGSVLMTVADPRRLRIRADIDETDVPLVRAGQPAKVFLQADERNPVAGTVDRVAPKGTKKDEVVSFETLISVAEDQPVLRPGMSSTVEVEVRRADKAVSVPVQAVVHRRRKDLPDTPEVRAWSERNAHSPGEKAAEAELRYIKIVFVVESGLARARPVETGLSDERRIEILSGVGPDDRVVVAPFRALDELKDGSPVVPVKVLAEGAGKR